MSSSSVLTVFISFPARRQHLSSRGDNGRTSPAIATPPAGLAESARCCQFAPSGLPRPVRPPCPSQVIHRGEVVKRRSTHVLSTRLAEWSRRYLLVTSHGIYVCASTESGAGGMERVLEMLPVDEVVQVARGAEWDFERNKVVSRFRDGKTERGEEDMVFVVSMVWGRSYVFKAQSAEEGHVWVRCIDAACKNVAAERASCNWPGPLPSRRAAPGGSQVMLLQLQGLLQSQESVVGVACMALANAICNVVLLHAQAAGGDGRGGGSGGDGGAGEGGIGPGVVYVNMGFGLVALVHLLLSMAAYGRGLVRRPWLVFDLTLALVVLICCLSGSAAAGRGLVTCLTVRVARVLELGQLSQFNSLASCNWLPSCLLAWLAPLKGLSATLGGARHTLMSTATLLMLLSVVHAVAGVALFAHHDPARFGTVGQAAVTLLLPGAFRWPESSSPAPQTRGRGDGLGGRLASHVVAAAHTAGVPGRVQRHLRTPTLGLDGARTGLLLAQAVLLLSYVVLCAVVCVHLLVVMLAQHQKVLAHEKVCQKVLAHEKVLPPAPACPSEGCHSDSGEGEASGMTPLDTHTNACTALHPLLLALAIQFSSGCCPSQCS